ncbi:MAG: glycogen debranching enzyme, partial [Streptosporangiaceae bacterium]|nr:glycogen debranching enzyme [Streptosporangiaceae bacterium]
LQDLVSYNVKHNEANGEDNRDGTDDNRSWNCGAEGPTDDPAVLALRARQKRNFLVTVFLSQGVPMLLAGDEMGRTQRGNNNAYCQDNEISWLDWDADDAGRDLLRFTETVAALRRDHPVFRRRRFFRGLAADGETGDIMWLTAGGAEMTGADWAAGDVKSLAVFLNGEAISEPDPRGGRITDAKFLLLFNAHGDPVTFTLPEAALAASWQVVVDTAMRLPDGTALLPKSEIEVFGRAVVVLRSTD